MQSFNKISDGNFLFYSDYTQTQNAKIQFRFYFRKQA